MIVNKYIETTVIAYFYAGEFATARAAFAAGTIMVCILFLLLFLEFLFYNWAPECCFNRQINGDLLFFMGYINI